MPQTATILAVSGTVRATADGTMLVLSERLDGHDTFLTGLLRLDGRPPIGVRILTFDDVTVLHVLGAQQRPFASTTWTGELHLPHGWRHHEIPADLAAAANRAGRDLAALDAAELRYALTFLHEATTTQIRSGRIEAIINALPSLPGPSA